MALNIFNGTFKNSYLKRDFEVAEVGEDGRGKKKCRVLGTAKKFFFFFFLPRSFMSTRDT